MFARLHHFFFFFFRLQLLFLILFIVVILHLCATASLQASLLSPAQDFSGLNEGEDTIQQLVAEPDYRALRLRWQYLSARRPPPPPGQSSFKADRPLSFIIRYCELAQWQTKKRCKEQRLPVEEQGQQQSNEFRRRSLASGGESTDEAILSPIRVVAPEREREEHRAFQRTDFEATLANLRMLTKYSVSVRAASSQDQSQSQSHHRGASEVFAQTKSFSAKTTRCLANSSVIEVLTGPYFGGKISVEGAAATSSTEEGGLTVSSCVRFGNRSSTQATYTLAIDHQLCGSKIINKTRIETMVIVHENRDILTHNSRRYLVLCTFTPQLYSLTASASVPSHLLRRVIEKLREKRLPFQLEVVKGGGDEKAKAAEKKLLKKRHSLNSSSSSSSTTDAVITGFTQRDSRMMTDGSGGGGKPVKDLGRKDDQNMICSSTPAATQVARSSFSASTSRSSPSPSSSSSAFSAVTISTIFCLSAAAALAAFLMAQKRNKGAAFSCGKDEEGEEEEEEEDSSKLNSDGKRMATAAAAMEA